MTKPYNKNFSIPIGSCNTTGEVLTYLGDYNTYVILKALPRVCTGNTARGGVSRDKYSTRQSRVLYLSRDTPPVLYFPYRRVKAVL